MTLVLITAVGAAVGSGVGAVLFLWLSLNCLSPLRKTKGDEALVGFYGTCRWGGARRLVRRGWCLGACRIGWERGGGDMSVPVCEQVADSIGARSAEEIRILGCIEQWHRVRPGEAMTGMLSPPSLAARRGGRRLERRQEREARRQEKAARKRCTDYVGEQLAPGFGGALFWAQALLWLWQNRHTIRALINSFRELLSRDAEAMERVRS